MAEEVVKFGVSGGTSLSGETGSLIKKQLESIAAQISENLTINLKIDDNHFSQQLTSLKEEIQKKLGSLEIAIKESENSVGHNNSSNGNNNALKIAEQEQLNVSKQSQIASQIEVGKLALQGLSLNSNKEYADIIKRNSEAKSMVDALNKSFEKAVDSPGSNTKEQVEALNAQLVQTQLELKKIGKEAEDSGENLIYSFGEKTLQTINQFILQLIVSALKQVYANVKAIDSAMTELKIATSATSKQLDEMAKSIAKSASSVGISMTELINATTAFAKLGYSLNEAQSLAEKTSIYAKVSGANFDEATTNVNGIINAYNIGADGLESVLDQLIWAGNKFSMSQSEIGEAMNNAASSLAAGGNTLQESVAIVAAANSALKDVGKSSTLVRTIAANITSNVAELQELGEDINGIDTSLASKMQGYDITITDANGELLSTYEILEKVADGWASYEEREKAAIATMLAGSQQQAAFYSIMENWGDAQTVVEQSGGAVGSLMEAQDARLDSIDGKIELLTARWESFSQTILESEIVKFFIDMANYVAEFLNIISALGNGAIPKFALITVAVLALAAVIKVLGTTLRSQLSTMGAALKTFMSDSAPMLLISGIILLMTTLTGKAGGWAQLIIGLIGAVVAAFMVGISLIGQALTGFMASNFVGWIMAIVAAIALVIKGIVDLVNAYNPSFKKLKEAANEAVDAWKEAEEELDKVREKIVEIEEEIERLNALENPSTVDEMELAKLQQELDLLKEQEAVMESLARAAQRDAMNATEAAIDKLLKDNKKVFNNIAANPKAASEALNEYYKLLSEFEYGNNEKLDSYFEDYWRKLDEYMISAVGAREAWASILSRVKNKDAVQALKDLADEYTDTSKITGDKLAELAKTYPEVQELFDYLKSVGMWDGEDWDSLTGMVGELRTRLTQLAEIDIIDDIEAISDEFETLSSALSDVANNGIVSLDTLQTLLDKYPSLLDKYFSKTLDGYKLSDTYKDQSSYDILQDMAMTSLGEYKTALEEAKEELAELGEEDDDYLTALKKVATAQDNLNNKEIEWASLLREAAIEDKTTSLEGMQSALKEQLNVYKELIDIRKDLLATYKEEVDYQKELAKKQKSVADLQTQLTLAKLDKSAAGQARARELESQLQSAQEELDEYTLEKAIDNITQTLENEYSEYEKFINEQVEAITSDLEAIAGTLDGILANTGALNTVFTAREMYDLYNDINAKQAAGMTLSDDATNFKNSYTKGDFLAAARYYANAKAQADEYKPSSQESNVEKSEDERKADEMKKVSGAWGSGIKLSKKGDNGTIVFNGKEYYVENGGDKTDELYKAAYDVNGYGDRDIFVYKDNLYGCLDGGVVLLAQRAHSYKDDSTEGWYALMRAVGVYHNGGFVGDISNLKSNEEFAKLLNGEFVTTPKQMDSFMKKTLPTMLIGAGRGGATINNNSPLIQISCAGIDNTALPKLETLVNQAVDKIERNMESALNRTGYKNKF